MSKEIHKNRTINLRKVCRSCLSERGHLREIYSTRIPKMMESCASIQVSENDGLPSNVCISCFHLIGKFFAFKKKMERSDRILRQYIENKVKQSDIINIALSEAEIHEPAEAEELVNSHKVFLKMENAESSDEDIPLSERITKTDDDCKSIKAEQLEELHYGESNIENTKDTVQIFADGPPPLVPLAPIEKHTQVDVAVKNLPNDTPPLVPIKPVVNIEVLENIIEKNEDIVYKCNNCNNEFSSVSTLKDHQQTTCQLNPLQCNICRKEFKESKKLIGHLKGHMIVKDYGCKICGKRYPNPSTFTVHMRTHTGERPFKCQICDKGFIRWAGVVGHMKTHEEHKPFTCEICNKCFKFASNLERHKVLHSGSLPYCCNYCGKCFSQSDNLQLHIRTYHTHERPYLCSECGKGFVSSTRLNRHMWVHTGYKPYICSSCPKAYSNSSDLKYHERHQHGKMGNDSKNLACDICDMTFFHPCRLARHKNTHQKPYTCHVCNKSFTSSAVLDKHIENKHGMTYAEESVLHPDEGVSQIFIEYQPQEDEKDVSILEYGNVESLNFIKTEEGIQFL